MLTQVDCGRVNEAASWQGREAILGMCSLCKHKEENCVDMLGFMTLERLRGFNGWCWNNSGGE